MAGQLKLEQTGQVAADELETLLFLRALEDRFGADFLAFELAPMHAKLAAFLVGSGAESISALQGRALRDDRLAADVIRTLNRSTGPVLDNVFHLMAMRCAVLPPLRSAPWPTVWVADCTDLHVPLLLLALLTEEELVARTRVFVTTGVEGALHDMRTQRLSTAELELLQSLHHGSGGRGQLQHYLRAEGDGFVLDPAASTALSWHVHHLGTDASFREFDAVIAPRPFSEYNDGLRTRALGLFSESLYPFGMLQLNDVQCSRAALDREQLEPVLGEYGIFRKVGMRHP